MIAFLSFSGLDIVGIFIKNIHTEGFQIEWWAIEFQFSSMITQLFWVFNQTIAPWLITLIFINEKNVRNYMLLILLCLPYGPLPFIGLIPLLGVRGVKFLIQAIKQKAVKEFIKDVISIENAISFFVILPVYYFFYTGNQATLKEPFRIERYLLCETGFRLLFVFWFLEIGIYAFLIFSQNKKNELFWTSAIALIFIPLFKIGEFKDFGMRASIPSIVIMDYYVIKFFVDNIHDKKQDISIIAITLVFIIGMITPFAEYDRAISFMRHTGKINAVADEIVTFSDKDPEEYINFVCINPKENSIFFKYLARK